MSHSRLLGLIHKPNPMHIALLLLNLAIVALMLSALRERRKARADIVSAKR